MPPLSLELVDLIAQLQADLPGVGQLQQLSEARVRAQALEDLGDHLVEHFVAEARNAGASWSEIGDALGVSKQAAQQRWASPLFGRFTNRMRRVLVRAQEQTRTYRHDYVGTEHLLLGILGETESVAVQTLVTLTGSVDAVERTVIGALTSSKAQKPPNSIPFTQLAKQAIQRSSDEAHKLGHSDIDSEHLLLALAAVPGGLASQVLSRLGVDYEAAYNEVRRLSGIDGTLEA